jgi:tRNA(Glu) U13 pseudouridine synthase TruD
LAELSRVEEDVLIDETPGQDIQVINADIQNGYAEMTVEEVDSATFTKEMKDQEAKMNGKKKGGDVAKASVQAVKQEEVELDERSLTSSETKKKEMNVKGMKKSLSGFKDRYGDKAKSVMYATATKMAKKD